jgi:hypothetical protein
VSVPPRHPPAHHLPAALPTLPLLQVIQARLAALEEDNHKADDVAAGSDDEEFELPKGSDEGGRRWLVGAAGQIRRGTPSKALLLRVAPAAPSAAAC